MIFIISCIIVTYKETNLHNKNFISCLENKFSLFPHQLPSDAFEEESSSSGALGPLFKILKISVTWLTVKSGCGSSSNKCGLSTVGIQTVPLKPASIPPVHKK